MTTPSVWAPDSPIWQPIEARSGHRGWQRLGRIPEVVHSDPADPNSLTRGTTSSGIAADDEGSIYSADVAAHNLRKYVKVK
jgi:hypothetical protein